MTNHDSGDAPGARAKAGRSSRRFSGSSAKARRKAARLAAVQALYQIDLNQVSLAAKAVEAVLGDFLKHPLGDDTADVAFVEPDTQLFADVVRGACYRREEVDGLLLAALDARHSLERLELPLRAILRAGAFELFANVGTHPRILISEYVDVAHAFFAGREPAMVNGVLDRVARTVRADDLAQPEPGRP